MIGAITLSGSAILFGDHRFEVPMGAYVAGLLIFSLAAGAASTPLAIGAVRSGDAKAFGPTLGFMSMAILVLGYGLGTARDPISNLDSDEQLSALLGLCLPSVFFALGYVRSPARSHPALPASWTVLMTVSAALLTYDLLAVSGHQLPGSEELVRPPASTALSTTSVLLLGFAAWRQSSAPVNGAASRGLVVAFGLLALAQVAMMISEPWTAAWLTYQVLLFVAATVALIALTLSIRVSHDPRALLESTLGLEVDSDHQIVGAVAALAEALDLKDHETEGHTVRVARLAVEVGRAMGLRNPDLRLLARAGLLHDIGKLGIADEVLRKRAVLTTAERVQAELHAELGARIVRRIGGFDREAAAIASHHERYDGQGYPARLAGLAIPLVARILSVVDTFDALTSDRPYRGGRPASEALEIIQPLAGSQFDPSVVNALVSVMAGATAPSGRRRAPAPSKGSVSEPAAPRSAKEPFAAQRSSS